MWNLCCFHIQFLAGESCVLPHFLAGGANWCCDAYLRSLFRLAVSSVHVSPGTLSSAFPTCFYDLWICEVSPFLQRQFHAVAAAEAEAYPDHCGKWRKQTDHWALLKVGRGAEDLGSLSGFNSSTFRPKNHIQVHWLLTTEGRTLVFLTWAHHCLDSSRCLCVSSFLSTAIYCGPLHPVTVIG